MTPAELRAAAYRVKQRKLIPRISGSRMDTDLLALADAARRLANVIEYAERQDENDTEAFAVLYRVLRIARGES